MDKKLLEELEDEHVPYRKMPPNADKFDPLDIFGDYYSTHVISLHSYKNKDNELLFYTVGLEHKYLNVKNDFRPMRWCYDTYSKSDLWWPVDSVKDKYLPIYGAEKLSRKNKNVLIVEDEKKADEVSKLLPKYSVISWVWCDAYTVKYVDWSQLKGENVVICTGCSKDGINTRKKVSRNLNKLKIRNTYINDVRQLVVGLQIKSNKQQHTDISQTAQIGQINKANESLLPVEQDNADNKLKKGDNIKKVFKREFLDNNQIIRTHEYLDKDNKLIGYNVIFKEKYAVNYKKSVKKILLSVDLNSDFEQTVDDWWSSNSPIYGAEKLSRKNKNVLIVGDEKAADKASKLFPEYSVISWFGGSKTAEEVDWTQLKGRNVIIWPDNDPAGIRAGFLISENLKNLRSTNCYLLEIERLWLDQKKYKGWNLSKKLPDGLKFRDIQLIIQKGERECGMPITPFKENKDKYISSQIKSNSQINPSKHSTIGKSKSPPPQKQQQNNSVRDGR
ncbi:MAG: hypothetical protein HRU35_02665 [Rickettsiaceae bacterium]|nr:hypothetical protein [Rickettsiaceae bacterium]